MKLLVKLFIYLTFVVIISVFNNVDMVQAESSNGMEDLLGMDDPPEKVPEFAPSALRMRRNVDPQTADEGDIPKEEPNASFRMRRNAEPQAADEGDIPQEEPNARLRTRRDAPPGESDVPKEFQEEPKTLREKRQMPPSPPEEMPMPPM